MAIVEHKLQPIALRVDFGDADAIRYQVDALRQPSRPAF